MTYITLSELEQARRNLPDPVPRKVPHDTYRVSLSTRSMSPDTRHRTADFRLERTHTSEGAMVWYWQLVTPLALL